MNDSQNWLSAFREAAHQASSYEPCVYFLYLGEALMYVGQTCNLIARLGTHIHQKPQRFTHFRSIHCPMDRLDEIEGFFIELFNPVWNKQLKVGSEWMKIPDITRAIRKAGKPRHGRSVVNELQSHGCRSRSLHNFLWFHQDDVLRIFAL